MRKRDPMSQVPPKMTSGEQNRKTVADPLSTAKNEFGSAKH
jgi:hypothetical protein